MRKSRPGFLRYVYCPEVIDFLGQETTRKCKPLQGHTSTDSVPAAEGSRFLPKPWILGYLVLL